MTWEVVIGLEVHCQLKTNTKIFSGASTAYGASPNTQADPVTLGLPGVLPVLNRDAVDKAIRFGLAVSAPVAPRSVFARKHYFYPDLPKGYQISQYELPVVGEGHLDIELPEGKGVKRIGITRAHLEEDAGKSVHEGYTGQSGIDLNRAGTPLLEIVSEPDLRSAAEAVAYLKTLHQLVTWIDICDGNMQEGSFRCDANVSVRRPGEPFGTRTETKNVNSFRFVQQAIDYEIGRQIEVLEAGGTIYQETRLFNPDTGETRAMRTKENANDYRYFPDPDLLPLVISAADVARVKAEMPELPGARRERFVAQYALPAYDAGVLTAEPALADYYEATVSAAGTPAETAKPAANWIITDLLGALNKGGKTITESPVTATHMAGLLARLADKTISGKLAKDVFEAMLAGEGTADEIIKARGLVQITDESAIKTAIQGVLDANAKMVADYRSGKDKLFGFFVGQAMKATQGKANPEALNRLLKEMLAG